MDEKVREALQAVIKECPVTGNGEYAKSYAKGALNWNYTPVLEMEGEKLRVQILYVLNNLAYWKGERAREIKGILKEASK